LLDRRALQLRRSAILLNDGEAFGAVDFVGVNMFLEEAISRARCL
jgi:hypothetical protein